MPSPRADRALQALAVGFVVLALAVFSSIWLVRGQQAATGWVHHTLEAQNQLATVMSRVQSAETGQRGYLISGEPVFLEPYAAAVDQLPKDLDALTKTVADNPIQSRAVNVLRVTIGLRMDLLRENLARLPQKKILTPDDLARLTRGKALMDEVHRQAADMSSREARLLERRTAAVQRLNLLVTLLLSVSGLATLGLGIFAVLDGRRRVRDAVAARDELATLNERLQAEAGSREAAEAQVRQMQKMEAVGQLTGGIAHDFNNMLAVVLGSLDLARRRIRTMPEKAESYIDNAVEGAQRATQLTGRLLAFSRQQPLAPRALDFNKLVAGMSELLRRSIGEEIQVETVLAGGLWRAFADPGQLENAILNLCVNARDAMTGGGKLTIETSNAHLDDAYAAGNAEVEPGQYVVVSVTDMGAGMTSEVLERAFDPFYTTKDVGKGTGLGLSQVHGFVKQSGGHVKIYSEPGVGTTVKLYLPRSLAAGKATADEAAATADLPLGKPGETIYVVEDEERVRTFTVDALRELGYKVIHASDGQQALAGMNQLPRIDLLFTDVVMPGLTGRQLVDQALKIRPDLKVLYTTGYTRNAIVHNGILDADVAFLPKPFSVAQLAVKVRRVLDGGGANRPSPEADSLEEAPL